MLVLARCIKSRDLVKILMICTLLLVKFMVSRMWHLSKKTSYFKQTEIQSNFRCLLMRLKANRKCIHLVKMFPMILQLACKIIKDRSINYYLILLTAKNYYQCLSTYQKDKNCPNHKLACQKWLFLKRLLVLNGTMISEFRWTSKIRSLNSIMKSLLVRMILRVLIRNQMNSKR